MSEENRSEFPDGCKYRPRGVVCRDWRTCAKCGWSPLGEKRRKEKLEQGEQHD